MAIKPLSALCHLPFALCILPFAFYHLNTKERELLLRDCFGFADASLLGMTQETENACLKPGLAVVCMLVPMLCLGTHTRKALRCKTARLGRRAPWRVFPRRTVGTRKQKPKQPLRHALRVRMSG